MFYYVSKKNDKINSWYERGKAELIDGYEEISKKEYVAFLKSIGLEYIGPQPKPPTESELQLEFNIETDYRISMQELKLN